MFDGRWWLCRVVRLWPAAWAFFTDWYGPRGLVFIAQGTGLAGVPGAMVADTTPCALGQIHVVSETIYLRCFILDMVTSTMLFRGPTKKDHLLTMLFWDPSESDHF